MHQVLIIDDDEQLTEVLEEYLVRFGFQVAVAHSPGEGLQQMRTALPEVLILDVMLPEMDGFQLCRKIRATGAWQHIPVLMLTARGEVTDRVVGLEIGADDYLAKPFDPRELVARLNSLLRRAPAKKPASIISLNGLTLDAVSQQVRLDGELLTLTTMEYELLKLLMTHAGTTFSRDELMNALRGIDAELFSRAIDTLVSRVRQKLGDTGKPPRFIKTVWGRGYCFIGEAEETAL
ncbi:MAG: response regulator transcription factor [Ketobacteraceae bacterium]|nr:response regulator transcription factor [Ketobacteraceae bacterium]